MPQGMTFVHAHQTELTALRKISDNYRTYNVTGQVHYSGGAILPLPQTMPFALVPPQYVTRSS